MEFQHVAFDRNPSNTVTDECFIEGTCREPLIQLSKIGNGRLESEFPEIVDFLFKFKMNSQDLLDILLYERALEMKMTEYGHTLTNDETNEIWYVSLFTIATSFFFDFL